MNGAMAISARRGAAQELELEDTVTAATNRVGAMMWHCAESIRTGDPFTHDPHPSSLIPRRLNFEAGLQPTFDPRQYSDLTAWGWTKWTAAYQSFAGLRILTSGSRKVSACTAFTVVVLLVTPGHSHHHRVRHLLDLVRSSPPSLPPSSSCFGERDQLCDKRESVSVMKWLPPGPSGSYSSGTPNI